jgi:hypothetical protein
MNEEQTPCVPAVMSRAVGGKQIGDYCSRVQGKRLAREELTRREGPKPFPGAVCRHLCKNDSQAKNGFVCLKHTTWGTSAENLMDQGLEPRKRGGRIAAESGQLREAGRVKVTCPHCGKTGAKRIMSRYHFDRCKHKLPQLSSPTQLAAHVGMASASPSHGVTQHTV